MQGLNKDGDIVQQSDRIYKKDEILAFRLLQYARLQLLIVMLPGQQNQHEYESDKKKRNDGQHGIAHAACEGFDDAKTKGTTYGRYLFHHIIKAEKGSMISRFGKHFGIGGSGKCLCSSHHKTHTQGNDDKSSGALDEVCTNANENPSDNTED